MERYDCLLEYNTNKAFKQMFSQKSFLQNMESLSILSHNIDLSEYAYEKWH